MTAARHQTSSPDLFQWQPQPRTWSLLRRLTDEFQRLLPRAVKVAQRMHDETGTRFIDWIDHLELPQSDELRQELLDAGFVAGGEECYSNPLGVFPRIVLRPGAKMMVGIKVESVIDCLAAWNMPFGREIHGDAFAPLRTACLFSNPRAELHAIERHGYRGFEVQPFSSEQAGQVLLHEEVFHVRPRVIKNEAAGFSQLGRVLDRAIADLGADRACDLFFSSERAYWQSRNEAAQAQSAGKTAWVWAGPITITTPIARRAAISRT